MTRGTALMIASAITRSSFIREINVRRRSAFTRPIARKPSDERSCAGTTIVTKVARSISTSRFASLLSAVTTHPEGLFLSACGTKA